MMPLPLRPSNQKSGVCPSKADTFSGEEPGELAELRSIVARMQAVGGQDSIQMG
jgi:hypothetical protein